MPRQERIWPVPPPPPSDDMFQSSASSTSDRMHRFIQERAAIQEAVRMEQVREAARRHNEEEEPYVPEPECEGCGWGESECECCPDCRSSDCECERPRYPEDTPEIPDAPHMTRIPGLDIPEGIDMHGLDLHTLAGAYRISDSLPDDPVDRALGNGRVDNYTIYLMEMLRGRLAHRGVLKSCLGCGSFFRASAITRPLNRCTNCARGMTTCRYCGALLQTRNGSTNCQFCLQQYINNYNYTANMKPRLTDDDLAVPARQRLLVGVEFEIEADAQLPLAKEIDDRYTWCYLKHDGSLQSGFEVVTYPFSEKWINGRESEMQDFFERVFRDAYLDYHCGTHFHLQKSCFTSIELYKLLKFIYTNEEIMFQISKREDRNWMERYATFKAEGARDLIRKAKKRTNIKSNPIHSSNGGKYVAVNFSKHDTIEFRFFAGCDSYDTFMEWLQFVLAAAKFAKAEPVNNMTWDRFTEWSRTLRYPYLQSLISGVAT